MNTGDETQIEMGYRFTRDFLDFVRETHPGRIVSDTVCNGGRVVVLTGIAVPGAFPEPAALCVYLCEDAQAWGTFTVCKTVRAAQREAACVLRALSN